MPSGSKVVVFNTLERAVSTDHNRAQSFAAADRAEVARYMMNVSMRTDDVDASGNDVQNTTLASPVSAEVIGGLVVRPAIGSLAVTVDPGIAWIIYPDADSDSSAYKLARDPIGTTSLTIGANSSGSTRIDVIECTYSLNANAETDNRDIFNPSTGSFTATTVSKATQGILTYRVRAGTPGAGFPGSTNGWLPLAVASVPTGTTTNDTVTFWDVRPLVADRWNAPHNVGSFSPRLSQGSLQVDAASTPGTAALLGFVETTASDSAAPIAAGLYRLGGYFGTFSTLDLNGAATHSGSVANGVAYVYLAEPFGLPRWAAYTPVSTGARQPTNPRGLVMVSNTGSTPVTNSPASPLPLPAALGLGGTVTKAALIAVVTVDSGLVQSLSTDGRTQFPSVLGGGWPAPSSAITGTVLDWTLVEGVSYPTAARSLLIQIDFNYVVNASTILFETPVLSLRDMVHGNTFSTQALPAFTSTNFTGSGQNFGQTWIVRIPVGFPTANLHVVTGVGGGATVSFPAVLTIVGWDI